MNGDYITESSIDYATNVTTIDRKAIIRSGARTLPELLRGQVGVYVSGVDGSGSSALVDMRGFGSSAGSNVLILLDGRRLNNSTDSALPDLSVVPLDIVDHVEVVQGSAGVLYGNQSVGGVINIITRKGSDIPSLQPKHSQLKLGAGSFDSYKVSGSTSGETYFLSLDTKSGNQFRDNSYYSQQNLTLSLAHSLSLGRFSFNLSSSEDYNRRPGSLFSSELSSSPPSFSHPSYKGDFNRVHTDSLSLSFDSKLSPSWSLKLPLSYRENKGSFKLSGRSWIGSRSTQDRSTVSIDPKLVGILPFTLPYLPSSLLKLIVGASVESTDYSLSTTLGTQRDSQSLYSLYSQLDASLTDEWSLSYGFRHASVSNSIFQSSSSSSSSSSPSSSLWVNSLSLTYEPSSFQPWKIFARWDQNYRFATVDEYTNVVTGTSSSTLKTQTGDSYEVGTSYNLPNLSLMLQGFVLDLSNEISFDSTTYFNVNLPSTRRKGVIFNSSYSPSPSLSLGGSYTYTDNTITSGAFKGSSIPLVPSSTAKLFVEYNHDLGYNARLDWNWVGSRSLGGDYTNTFSPLPSFSTLDLVGGYSTKFWGIQGRVNNLLDEYYSESGAVGYDASFFKKDAYFPSPGRSFWVTFSHSF